MPLSNPFRRQPKRPSLRERAAELKAGLSRAIRQPASEPVAAPEAVPADSLDEFAEIEFDAYALDEALKTPTAWATRFLDYAVAMHVADRTVRMTKPELIAFIREAGEKDPETPAAMFHALDSGQKSLEGWGNLLGLARARYIVAASAERLEPVKEGDDEPKAAEPPQAAPVVDTSTLHRDLTTAILDGWREWGSVQASTDDAVQSEADARRRALIHAAMALPATPENIAPKALACAWMEWVGTERPGQPRDTYGPADQLVYDIHAAAMARGAPENSQPTTAQPRGIDLVSRIDFAAATMNELLHIRSIADHIGSMAYAHHQGTRCEGGRNAFGFRLENDLGKLMISLGDALTEVESAADAEAKRRTPDSAGDRQTRLFMLTPPAIDNDDPDEIEALALQMLAHAATERAKG